MRIRVGILTAPRIEWEQREKTFVLKRVRIGIGFHWDRYEEQEFMGELTIRTNPDGTQTAVNTIDLEDYLCSVISSEMRSDSPMELLKAHAVISRSWAIRAMAKPNHEGFDVCADDHCQRYEGIRRLNDRAVEAVRATAGQVLTYSGEVCDTRYYKCCGGRTEIWRTCWEDMDVPYIRSVECPYCDPAHMQRTLPDSTAVLRSCLNDYDLETRDFHDWQVTYTEEQLDAIVRNKSGIDFGHITAIEPLHRGASGRIDRLRITGTKHTEIIGKELKIRLWLSPSCLYSSWFDIEHQSAIHNSQFTIHNYQLPMTNHQSVWVLSGHGWGHGAGLCQIGAAVMAAEGKSYEEILGFYYPGTLLNDLTANDQTAND